MMEWQRTPSGDYFEAPGAVLVVRSVGRRAPRFAVEVAVRDGRSEHDGIVYYDDEALAKERGLERLHAALFDAKEYRRQAVKDAEAALDEVVEAIDKLQRVVA